MRNHLMDKIKRLGIETTACFQVGERSISVVKECTPQLRYKYILFIKYRGKLARLSVYWLENKEKIIDPDYEFSHVVFSLIDYERYTPENFQKTFMLTDLWMVIINDIKLAILNLVGEETYKELTKDEYIIY